MDLGRHHSIFGRESGSHSEIRRDVHSGWMAECAVSGCGRATADDHEISKLL